MTDFSLPLEIRAQLTTLLNAKGRSYHTTLHVNHFLRLIAWLADKDPKVLAKIETFIWGAWIHDAIYDPLSRTNESESARLGLDIMYDQNKTEEMISDVVLMVSASAHRGFICGPDQDVDVIEAFLDIDKAILGENERVYADYINGIANEYLGDSHLTYAEFAKGRAKFLTAILARERIYVNPFMHERFEEQARINMTIELAAIQEDRK